MDRVFHVHRMAAKRPAPMNKIVYDIREGKWLVMGQILNPYNRKQWVIKSRHNTKEKAEAELT